MHYRLLWISLRIFSTYNIFFFHFCLFFASVTHTHMCTHWPALCISSFLSGNIGNVTELVVALLDPVQLPQRIHYFPLDPLQLLQTLTHPKQTYLFIWPSVSISRSVCCTNENVASQLLRFEYLITESVYCVELSHPLNPDVLCVVKTSGGLSNQSTVFLCSSKSWCGRLSYSIYHWPPHAKHTPVNTDINSHVSIKCQVNFNCWVSLTLSTKSLQCSSTHLSVNMCETNDMTPKACRIFPFEFDYCIQ